ncbi:MAG: DUF86 domain-containing protein [Coriobacteriia bacterium]|nr:DUF86 domain-containing protein [Coriobacteriia bacterium]
MSGRRDDSLLLGDMLDAAERLIELASGVPDGWLGQDQDTNEKMLWNLVVLGEAVKRMRPLTRQRFSDVPWKLIADTRDWVIDHYDGVDWQVVTLIVTRELPRLLPRLREIRDIVRAEFDAGGA